MIIQLILQNVHTQHLEELRLLDYSKNHKQEEFNKDILIVHAIPYSHNDVGWIRTFQEYYDALSSTQDDQQKFKNVRQIFDSVFENLIVNPSYTFIISEIAYFDKWWDELLDSTKEDVKNLIKNGQIEFVSGGWVQNDEACSYYEDIIDQMTTGHQFLYEQFKLVPSIAWQMDPFGHSRSQAYLFSQMGFNANFLGRIDIFEEYQRLDDNEMKFMWKADFQSYIYSEILFNKYLSPKGFDFDIQSLGKNSPITDSNVDYVAEKLSNYFKNVSIHYPGKNFLQIWGDDFTYSIAEYEYQNLTKIFNKINENQDKYKIQIQFSTPSKYLKALQQEKLDLNQKQKGDFFPYRDAQNGFWTGFFSSRVDLKGMIIKTGKYLHSMRNYMLLELLNQQRSFEVDFNQIKDGIKYLEKAQSVQQHHDCITGTSTLYVAENYKYILKMGINKFNSVLFSLLKNRTLYDIDETVQYNLFESNIENIFSSDDELNQNKRIKQFLINSKNILVSVYNPQNILIQKILRLNVNSKIKDYNIIDQYNQIVHYEYFCPINQDDCQLYFDAHLKPQQINYFKIVKFQDNNNKKQQNVLPIIQKYNSSITLNNQQKIEFINQVKGKQSRSFIYTYFKSVGQDYDDKFQQNFQINYGQYEVSKSNGQHEGAYVFRPDISKNISFYYTSTNSDIVPKIFEGQLVSCMIFETKELNMILRLLKYQNYIQIETYIRKVNVLGTPGKNIVLQVVNNFIKNKDEFFTDSNGLFIEKRKRNDKEKFQFSEDDEKISNNYYPVTSLIMIQDHQNSFNRMIIYNDRSQGGSSQQEGSLELMIVRSILTNDQKGMYEKFQDEDDHLLYHYLSFDLNDSQIRKNQLQFDQHPQMFIALTETQNFSINNKSRYKRITNLVLQENLKLTLRYWLQEHGEEHFIFRLQNMDTQNILFKNNWEDIIVINQTTLTGNQNISTWYSVNKLNWCYNKLCEQYQQIDSNIKQFEIEPQKFITFKIKSKQGLQNLYSQCPENMFQINEDSKIKCQVCSFPCQKCYKRGKKGCLSCQLNLLLTENHECVKTCPIGFLPDYKSFKCIKQQRCQDNYFFQQLGSGNQVGECMKECFSNYWKNYDDLICHPCKQNCEICLNSDQCQQCSIGYFEHNNKCLKDCQDGYQFNIALNQCTKIQKKSKNNLNFHKKMTKSFKFKEY